MSESSKVFKLAPSEITQTVSFGATSKRFFVRNLGHKPSYLYLKKTNGSYNDEPFPILGEPEEFELATDAIKINTVSNVEITTVFEEA